MTQEPITELLQRLRDGGSSTLDELLPVVYDELRSLARSYLSRERSDHTLQPTALVHEVYMRLAGQKAVDWKDRAHFFGFSARLMRQILIEHARGKNRLKRGGEMKTRIVVDDNFGSLDASALDVVAVDEALSQLEKLDPRQARIVELKFFGGLTVEEVSEVAAISTATVKREWATAKLFLYKALASRSDGSSPLAKS